MKHDPKNLQPFLDFMNYLWNKMEAAGGCRTTALYRDNSHGGRLMDSMRFHTMSDRKKTGYALKLDNIDNIEIMSTGIKKRSQKNNNSHTNH